MAAFQFKICIGYIKTEKHNKLYLNIIMYFKVQMVQDITEADRNLTSNLLH